MQPLQLPSPCRLLATIAVISSAGCSGSPTGPNDNTWLQLPGHVERVSVPTFRNNRPCWVYLPPGYSQTNRRYPVLYMHDGELVFDAQGGMHVNRICETLIRRGQIRPLIVVAVGNGHTPFQRNIDYTPWEADFFPGMEGGGDLYIRAIRDTLKPEIDRRFRTLADPFNTAIAGASLGGLISVYAAYSYDSTFGKVAAFSPSYWWSGFHQFVEGQGRPPLLARFYQDTGTPDDNIIWFMEQIALGQGFQLGVDFVSYEVPGANHDFAAWEHRFPVMLRFLFPPN